MEKETKRPEGRPTVMDEMTLYKLEGAFADGASDKMACFLAEISEKTLYNYQEKHPEFLQRKEYLKDQVKFQAKKAIRESVAKGDIETAKWFAERKLKDEGFSSRTEVTGKDGEDLKIQPVLVKFMDCGKSEDN